MVQEYSIHKGIYTRTIDVFLYIYMMNFNMNIHSFEGLNNLSYCIPKGTIRCTLPPDSDKNSNNLIKKGEYEVCHNAEKINVLDTLEGMCTKLEQKSENLDVLLERSCNPNDAFMCLAEGYNQISEDWEQVGKITKQVGEEWKQIRIRSERLLEDEARMDEDLDMIQADYNKLEDRYDRIQADQALIRADQDRIQKDQIRINKDLDMMDKDLEQIQASQDRIQVISDEIKNMIAQAELEEQAYMEAYRNRFAIIPSSSSVDSSSDEYYSDSSSDESSDDSSSDESYNDSSSEEFSSDSE